MGQNDGKQRAWATTPKFKEGSGNELIGGETQVYWSSCYHTAPSRIPVFDPKEIAFSHPSAAFFPFQKQPTILFNERHIYEQSNDPHKNFIEGRKNKLLAHD